MTSASDYPIPDQCILTHRLFTTLGEPVFRKAEGDGAPVMVVRLGERDVVLPLRTLPHEFGIVEGSSDGRMLQVIAAALDFVSALRIGDKLPAEVLTGEASWEPDPSHLQLATTRLKLQLVAWLKSGTGVDQTDVDPDALLQVADDPAIRRQVQEAMTRAAQALGLADREAVLVLIEELARELAYIEALRDRLLRRMLAMGRKVEHLHKGRSDATHMETLTQVRRLSGVAIKQLVARFEAVDGQTGEVMAALRNAGNQREFIREQRDWMYRSLLGWQPILLAWDNGGNILDDPTRTLLSQSYQFLAPRFMPVTEWISASRPSPKKPDTTKRMVW
jgi:hypothetical protein